MARGRDTLAAIWSIMRDGELSAGAKVLWTIYRSYDSDGGGAWPSTERLVEHTGLSERSIRVYRSELIRAGLLVARRRGPRPTRYWAVAPGDTSCRCPECRAADARGEHAGHVVARPPTLTPRTLGGVTVGGVTVGGVTVGGDSSAKTGSMTGRILPLDRQNTAARPAEYCRCRRPSDAT